MVRFVCQFNYPKEKSMLAFTNTTFTKESAVGLAKLHQEQDDFIRGAYGEETPTGWKGCSVGCMAKGKHGDYCTLFGIDPKIAYLSDKFFENITDFKGWTVKLFESVKEGSDTTIAYYKFMHWLLLDKEHGVVKHNKHSSILQVGALFLAASLGESVTQQQWKESANAAANAANAAANTANAAANTAAYAAANAAYAAAYAANTAAYAAVNAAYAAAYATADAAAIAAYAAANAAYATADAAANAAYAAAANAAYAAAYAASAAANATAYATNAASVSARTAPFNIMADKLCYFLAGN